MSSKREILEKFKKNSLSSDETAQQTAAITHGALKGIIGAVLADFEEKSTKMTESFDKRTTEMSEAITQSIKKQEEVTLNKIARIEEKLEEKLERMTKDNHKQILRSVTDGQESMQKTLGAMKTDQEVTKSDLDSKLNSIKLTPGKQGQPGMSGEGGRQGETGAKGKDGNTDTPNQIAKKLNELENKVDIKVIKGLEKWANGLIRQVKSKMHGGGGGGGGMGDVIHEQFSGDGATTSFTLSNGVAAGGNAVMACRYQGQVLYLGDQFTISGTTLAFTFTPLDATTIEITYIRG